MTRLSEAVARVRAAVAPTAGAIDCDVQVDAGGLTLILAALDRRTAVLESARAAFRELRLADAALTRPSLGAGAEQRWDRALEAACRLEKSAAQALEEPC